jgi:hypothetical protein
VALRCNKVLAIKNNLLNKPCVELPGIHLNVGRRCYTVLKAKAVGVIHADQLYALVPQLPDLFNIPLQRRPTTYKHHLDIVGWMRHDLLEALFDVLPDVLTNLLKLDVEPARDFDLVHRHPGRDIQHAGDTVLLGPVDDATTVCEFF